MKRKAIQVLLLFMVIAQLGAQSHALDYGDGIHEHAGAVCVFSFNAGASDDNIAINTHGFGFVLSLSIAHQVSLPESAHLPEFTCSSQHARAPPFA